MSFFTETAKADEQPRTYLSQSSTVLSAAINVNPVGAKGGPDFLIEGDALVPTVTMDGSTAGESRPSSDQIARYIVREGDTLSSIAKMFGVSVNTIRWSNDMRTNTIRKGEELIILPVDGIQYTVKKGDTLASIGKRFKGDEEEIVSFNDLSGSALKAGDIIVIPDGVQPASPAGTVRRVASAGPSLPGYFIRPVSGPKTQGIHGNNGVDLGSPAGTPVRAAAGGEIIIARSGGWNGGYGEMVVISHPNGTQTLYSHLSRVDVFPGQIVDQGEMIGAVGSTGRSTGSHLHFEVRGAKNPF